MLCCKKNLVIFVGVAFSLDTSIHMISYTCVYYVNDDFADLIKQMTVTCNIAFMSLKTCSMLYFLLLFSVCDMYER